MSCCEQPTVFSSIVFRHLLSLLASFFLVDNANLPFVYFFIHVCRWLCKNIFGKIKLLPFQLFEQIRTYPFVPHSPHASPAPPPLSPYVSYPLRMSDRCYPYGRDEHIQRDGGSIVTMRALTRRRSNGNITFVPYSRWLLLYQCHFLMCSDIPYMQQHVLCRFSRIFIFHQT